MPGLQLNILMTLEDTCWLLSQVSYSNSLKRKYGHSLFWFMHNLLGFYDQIIFKMDFSHENLL